MLINLTKSEIEAMVCDYLEKGCASSSHHTNKITAQAKMLKALKEQEEKVIKPKR